MHKFISIVSFIFLLAPGYVSQTYANTTFLHVLNDTISDTPANEDAAIDEILKSRVAPTQEKIQYFNQITRYGFKSLFKNFSYNSSMPYSSQVNPYAETYMQDYLHANGSYLKKMRGRATPYFNLIDNILSQYGLPKELKYLAVIESDLKSGATSCVGAKGPWQFMSYTAKDYGLQVNGFIDERTDYYKSTYAAARYLLSLYKDLKDWLLVIAAYNGGPGRVYNAIRQSGSRNFWALQYYLPTESRNHVKKFIATHYIMESSDNNNLFVDGANKDYLVSGIMKSTLSEIDLNSTEILSITGKYNSIIICKNLLFDINEFNRLNPGFDAILESGEPFDLRLPTNKMDLFVANKYPILNECVQVILQVDLPVRTAYKQKLIKKN